MADSRQDVNHANEFHPESSSDVTSSKFLREVHRQCELKGVDRLFTQSEELVKDVILYGAGGFALGVGELPGAAIGLAIGIYDSDVAVNRREASCRARLMENALRKQNGDKK